MVMTETPPELTEPQEPSGPRHRRPWLLGAAALIVLGVVVAVLLLSGDDDEPSPPPSTSALPDPLTDGSTDADTVELIELLADGRASTYRAVYRSSGTDDDVTLEIWRRDGRLRQDTLTRSGDLEVQTSSFLLDDKGFSCSLLPGEDWVCTEAAGAGAVAEDGVFGSVQDQLAGSQVTARDGELDGRDVRCFAYSGEATPGGEICVTTDGVPARIKADDATIELAELDGEVDDDVFTLPADPVQE